jgi:hypothetical protein
LAADALLVALGTKVFASTRGYVHFGFADYSKLTIIGVVIACLAWPVVTRISSTPRWLFFRLAVLVTIVLWLPDLWLVIRHQPVRAVAVLMTMHLAIALVTYNALVHVAPERSPDHGHGQADPAALSQTSGIRRRRHLVAGHDAAGPEPSWVWGVVVWVAMVCAVGLEFVVGVVALLVVPIGRPDQWIPRTGRSVYLVHVGLGGLLVLGAGTLLAASWSAARVLRLSALAGAAGILLGACGGMLAVVHAARLGGIVLMFLGSTLAVFGYVTPVVDSLPSETL